MSAGPFFGSAEMSVASVNAAHRPTPSSVRRRARRGLRPVEVALFARYRTQLSGRVLEIGSRGDGLTEALSFYADCFTGVAFSVPEVELCRARYIDASFEQRDLVDLDNVEDGHFDAVVAGRFALDYLAHSQRDDALARLSRVMADDGVLILSSHNLAAESLVHPPLRQAFTHPWHAWRLPRALRNRALLGRLQQRSYGYAVLNDSTDAYSRLSYYVSPDEQERELMRHDLRLVECMNRSDRPVETGMRAERDRELHFVAQHEPW